MNCYHDNPQGRNPYSFLPLTLEMCSDNVVLIIKNFIKKYPRFKSIANDYIDEWAKSFMGYDVKQYILPLWNNKTLPKYKDIPEPKWY